MVAMTSPPKSTPQVKGLAFRSVVKALEQLRGKATADAVLQKLPPQLAEGIRYGTITATGWYPIDWYRELFQSIVATTGEGDRIVREIGRESAKLDMSGVYKYVFKLLTPRAIFELSTRLFSNYYDTGAVRIVESRSGFVHVRWSGCKGFDRNLWLEVVSSCETYLELARASNVRTRIVAGAGADDVNMDVQAFWT
jgi:hypothetical protein